MPGAWDAFRVPGQPGAYALPWYLTSEVTMYNRDLYARAGLDPANPPRTVEDLVDQTRRLSEAGKGAWYGWHPAIENTFVPNLAKLGVPLLDAGATKWTFNTPEAVRYVTALRDLYAAKAFAPDWLTQNHAKATEAYSAGRTVLFPSGPNFLTVVGQNAPDVARATGVAPHVNQIQLNPWIVRAAERRFHAAHGIVTESWAPIGKGGDLLAEPAVVRAARRHGRTPAQVVLRWHVQLGLVAIPKTAHPRRLVENLAVFDFALDADEMAEITALDRGGEGVVAEVDAAQGPGENLVLDAVTPVPGAAVPAVEAVHDVAAVR